MSDFRALALAGTVAILLFATVGQLSHDGSVSLGGYAADALPLLGAWLGVAAATRRFVPTWLVGVVLGVAIRMVVLGHYHWNQLAFGTTTLLVVGALAYVLRVALPRVSLRR